MSVSVDTLLAIYLLLLGGGAGAAVILGAWVARARPPRTPLGLATFAAVVTCLGGAGVLALYLFEFGPGWSLLAAALFAILSGALFGALGALVRRALERREVLADLVGGLASVVVAIEPGYPGAVTSTHPRQNLTLVATSHHAQVLPSRRDRRRHRTPQWANRRRGRGRAAAADEWGAGRGRGVKQGSEWANLFRCLSPTPCPVPCGPRPDMKCPGGQGTAKTYTEPYRSSQDSAQRLPIRCRISILIALHQFDSQPVAHTLR